MAAVRKLVGVIAAATLGASLAGCTSDEPGATPEPTPSATTPSASESSTEPVALELAVYGGPRRVAVYERIVAAFTDEHPEVEVELTSYPDAEAAAESIEVLLANESGPDVFLLDPTYLPSFVQDERLQPLDTLLEDRGLQFGDDYQRAALTAFSASSRLQCMPAEMSPLVVYYNRDLISRQQLAAEEIVLPRGEETWTWEEFVVAARQAALTDGFGPVKGVHLPADLETLTAFIRSAGGEVVDDLLEPTSLTLTSDDALTAIAEVVQLARDDKIALSVEDVEKRPAIDWFTDGQLGMFIGTREDLPRLRKVDGLRFDAVSLPSLGRSRSVSRMSGLCIAARSDSVDAAADLVAFAVGPEGSRIAARSGAIVPAKLDVIHDEAFTQPSKQPRSAEAFAAGVRRSDPLPYSAAWVEVEEAADEVLTGLYRRPGLNLDEDELEARLARLDQRSVELFADAETVVEE
ncbi:MAG TPA: extracellular solute-binding protein [Marmoricola sp.]|nr:extracellular solute-binding protein [Marmoricola sp.]